MCIRICLREGSYVGKGIYDVDAFRQATAGRFPENLILSHDLVESGYARSALVTDVELQEDHPASFAVEMSRRHRWIRGDWQIAGWLLPRVLGPAKKRLPNTLTALGWWKIFDNLRRSLVPPALLLLLLGGWLMAPEPTGFWTRFVLLLLLLPVLLATLVEMARKPRERTWAIHLDTAVKSLGRQLAEAGLTLCTLPYRAVINLDAILDSGGRMLFTRRGLLLWHTPRLCEAQRPHHAGRFPSRDVGRAAVRRGRYRVARVDTSRRTDRQRAGVAAVAGVARRRLVDQPATRRRQAGLVRRATDVSARPGPANLALLRSAGQRGRKLAAARQFSGSPDTRGRLPHLAHQHRHGLAGQSGGGRFRLSHHRPTARPHRQNPHHDGTTRTLPGSFLQLVRHAHAQTAAPALRVECR